MLTSLCMTIKEEDTIDRFKWIHDYWGAKNLRFSAKGEV